MRTYLSWIFMNQTEFADPGGGGGVVGSIMNDVIQRNNIRMQFPQDKAKASKAAHMHTS